MNEKITLQDFINLLCEKQSMDKKDAELFVKTMFDLIKESLSKDKYVKIKGLGTFKLTEVGSRESVHINTGERIEIQGHTKISFTPDTTMKDLINKPFAHFEPVVLNDGVVLEDTAIENVTDEVPIIEEPQPEPIVEMPVPVEEPVEEPAAEEPIVEEPMEEPILEEPIVEEQLTEEAITEEVVTTEEPVVEEPTMEETTLEEPVEEEVPTIETEEPVEETPTIEPQPEITETKEETPEKPESIEEKRVQDTKEKSINRILWGVIVVLVLIILFGAYWMFFRPSDAIKVTPAPPVQEEAVTIQVEDSTRFTIIEECEPPIFMQPLKLTAEELRKERVPALADTLEYLINGSEPICEHALKSGETIIRISVKYYGSKRFWPYIAKFNSDKIKDPDNIPIGTTIKIPAIVPKK